MYCRARRSDGNYKRLCAGFLLPVVTGLLVSCSAVQGKKLLRSGYVKPGNTGVRLSANPTDSVVLHYFGCGGFYIRYADEALLVDPFVSNPPLGAPLHVDTASVDRLMEHATGMSKGQPLPVKAVLCTHAHYDHLMDTPYILEHWLGNTPVFAGNRTANKMMQNRPNFGPGINLDAGNGAFTPGKRIRITPVLLSHPPHFGNIKLYGGEFKPNAKPGQSKYWQCGQTYGFLLDFMDQTKTDRIVFRIYLQTSSGLLGLDNIPDAAAAGHAIDLMVLPAALYSRVKGYPEELLRHYRPKHVLVCHWENFFKPMHRVSQKPYTVGLTDVPAFALKLEREMSRSGFTIPMPDSRFVAAF